LPEDRRSLAGRNVRSGSRKAFWLARSEKISFWRCIGNLLPFSFLVFLAFSLLFLAGCEKSSVKKPQLRAISGEIVAAAQRISGRRIEVTVHHGNADTIFVSLANPSQELALRSELADIAQRHKLSIVEVSSGGVNSFDLSFQGTRTQTVRLVTPLAARAPSASREGGAKLAVIIDDLGNDRSAGNGVVSLPFPVTVSVLPNLAFSAEIAEEAYRRGDQVLLHLPMEAQSSSAQAEKSELRVGMNEGEVRAALSSMLETVPHVAGVNNHEGSRATSDSALMNDLMPALHQRGLFFVDSRTSASTVAYDAAKHAGVASASRKVFLDDNIDRDAILAQIDLAVRDAMRDGSAIAIGHPHPATISALAQSAPSFEARGIRLVFASELVH
jgi:polysaccharide deacetylase 2 family uncharacterized protein YibQ